MTIHSKFSVAATEKELAEKTSALVSALSKHEISGEELNRRSSSGRYQTAYPDGEKFAEVNPSEIRLAVDYLSAYLREVRRKFGK